MDWSDVGEVVSNVAPILGGILGGPVGLAVGAAGKLAASALGCEPEPDAVAVALQSNPEALLKIKQLEADSRVELQKLQLEQVREANKNTANARQREVDMARAGHGAAWTTSLVAVMVTAGFFVMLRFVLDQPQVSQAALLLLGSLGSAFGAVVNYYLGSSLGSQEKNRVLTRRVSQFDSQSGYLGAMPDNTTNRQLAAKYKGL